MVKSATIFVEKFKEGITIRWKDDEGIIADMKSLAPNGKEAEMLGNQIWEDLEYILNDADSQLVQINVEYKKV